MKHVCKHPERLGEHVRHALTLLKAYGATGITVLRKKYVQVRWWLAGRQFSVSLAGSSHPGIHATDIAEQAIRRKLHGAGIAVPVGA